MDINSHIDWRPGMPLKAQTFEGLYRNIDTRDKLLLKLYGEGAQVGILPDTEVAVDGVFVRNTFEIDRLRITALLRDGNIIDADETMSISIPMLSGDAYYLGIAPSGESIAFESKDVRYLRPKYAYALLTMDELQRSSHMPIAKFRIDNNQFHIDSSYILPYLLIGGCQALLDYHKAVAEKLYALCQHPNLVDPDGHHTILQQLFDFKTLGSDTKTSEWAKRLQEIALSIDYFVMRPNSRQQELPQPSVLDLRPYLEWVLQFIDQAIGVLDTVVIEDNSIDYDKLKQEIKDEIYARVNPELYQRLIEDLQEKLRTELSEKLTATLSEYIATVVQPMMSEKLAAELSQSLQSELYPALYDALYQALYIPPEEEEDFMPMI